RLEVLSHDDRDVRDPCRLRVNVHHSRPQERLYLLRLGHERLAGRCDLGRVDDPLGRLVSSHDAQPSRGQQRAHVRTQTAPVRTVARASLWPPTSAHAFVARSPRTAKIPASTSSHRAVRSSGCPLSRYARTAPPVRRTVPGPSDCPWKRNDDSASTCIPPSSS